jgi:predicted amidohydrolase
MVHSKCFDAHCDHNAPLCHPFVAPVTEPPAMKCECGHSASDHPCGGACNKCGVAFCPDLHFAEPPAAEEKCALRWPVGHHLEGEVCGRSRGDLVHELSLCAPSCRGEAWCKHHAFKSAAEPPLTFEQWEELAEAMVTVTPNITGDRVELWLCGSYRISASADVQDVLNAAKHIREDITAFFAAWNAAKGVKP